MRQTVWVAFGASVLGLFVGILITQNGGTNDVQAQSLTQQRLADSDDAPTTPALAPVEYTAEEKVNFHVYDSVNRGVVHITTKSARTNSFLLFETPTEGAGSGSVLDKDGHLLTNYHVVRGAREIYVRLYNGEEYPAGVVGVDALNDVAVLKIEASANELHPILIGDSSKLRIGQRIHALGNPFGLERTYTVGIVSSLNRTLPTADRRTMKSIIQIDAALNQGNSGGPLLNSAGHLVGVNTAIASSIGENTGVGFAIPANTVKRVVAQLLRDGKIIRPDIGITRVYQVEQGLLIATIARGGPAEQAGLKGFKLVKIKTQRGPFVYEETRVDQSQADRIIAVDGQQVDSVDSFLTAVESHQPGEEVVVTVIRDGQRIDVKVTLGEE
jgi:S1-C subfamily serine protease